jgi:hypothetical protein
VWFWEALTGLETDGDEIVTSDCAANVTTKQRMSQVDVRNIWKEATLKGWAGKLREELLKGFIQSKNYCPI